MCKAMEEMRAEQNISTLLTAVKNLMKNLGMTAEQAMTALGVTCSERHTLEQLLKNA